MSKVILKKPFFGINPKNYIYGQKSIDYAIALDELANSLNIDIYYNASYFDIEKIAKQTKRIVVASQHMDPISIGRGMGKVLPEALKDAGCKMVFINHVENPLCKDDINKCIEICNKLDMISEVAASTKEEVIEIAKMHPDMICVEEANHIASNSTSSDEYFIEMLSIIKNIDPNIQVELGGSIKTSEDVYHMFALGADATGATSAIMNAPNMIEKTTEMLQGLIKYNELIKPR